MSKKFYSLVPSNKDSKTYKLKNYEIYCKANGHKINTYVLYLLLVIFPTFLRQNEYLNIQNNIVNKKAMIDIVDSYNNDYMNAVIGKKDIFLSKYRVSKSTLEIVDKYVNKFINIYGEFALTQILSLLHIFYIVQLKSYDSDLMLLGVDGV